MGEQSNGDSLVVTKGCSRDKGEVLPVVGPPGSGISNPPISKSSPRCPSAVATALYAMFRVASVGLPCGGIVRTGFVRIPLTANVAVRVASRTRLVLPCVCVLSCGHALDRYTDWL